MTGRAAVLPWLAAAACGKVAVPIAPEQDLDCDDETRQCEVPASFEERFAARVIPPAGSGLPEVEFGPGDFDISGGDVTLQLPPVVELAVVLRRVGDAAACPADEEAPPLLRVLRSSRVYQRVEQVGGDTPIDVEARVPLAAGVYDLLVEPRAPEDQCVPPATLRGVSVPADAPVELRLEAPPARFTIAGEIDTAVPLPAGAELAIRASHEVVGDRTTVDRGVVCPGESSGCPGPHPFELRRGPAAGRYRVAVRPARMDVPVPEADYLIDVEADPAGEPGPRTVHELPYPAFAPPRCVQGSITSEENGEPVPGAAVFAVATLDIPKDEDSGQDAGETARATYGDMAETDADGAFRLRLITHQVDAELPLAYSVTVAPPIGSEFATRREERVAPAGSDEPCPAALFFQMQPRPTLTGAVVDGASGRPAAGVTVRADPVLPAEITDQPAASPRLLPAPFSTVTDARGRFALRLDPGDYAIEFRGAEGSGLPFWSLGRTATVNLFGETPIGEVRSPPTVLTRATVTSPSGPVPGAAVQLFYLAPEGGPALLRASAVTGERGEAILVLPR